MTTSLPLSPGDVLKIERRYVVDGIAQTATDEGRFGGVQLVGTSEHLVLRGKRGEAVRMFPLHSVHEITLVKRGRRATSKKAAPKKPDWNPEVA